MEARPVAQPRPPQFSITNTLARANTYLEPPTTDENLAAPCGCGGVTVAVAAGGAAAAAAAVAGGVGAGAANTRTTLTRFASLRFAHSTHPESYACLPACMHACLPVYFNLQLRTAVASPAAAAGAAGAAVAGAVVASDAAEVSPGAAVAAVPRPRNPAQENQISLQCI
jgi:pyruvate/2-oxoglutarate dehydrogenase complex dihydrolipoamide acyltransferase (E2) component